jgi:hypothetical protein
MPRNGKRRSGGRRGTDRKGRNGKRMRKGEGEEREENWKGRR